MRSLLRQSTIATVLTLASLYVHALPEADLGSKNNDAIVNYLTTTTDNYDTMVSKLQKTGIEKLDALWDRREDMIAGKCDSTTNTCRRISVFRDRLSNLLLKEANPSDPNIQPAPSEHPVVLLPGFTGYRKMYIEQIYDLLEAGYGPIYIDDFAGTGDSFRQELKAGQPVPHASDYINGVIDGSGLSTFKNMVTKYAPAGKADEIANDIAQIPVGIGYITSFNEYVTDINTIMSLAAKENPMKKTMIVSLSMSGLSALESLYFQSLNPTWIRNVGRIVLESPMVQIKTPVPGVVTNNLSTIAATAAPTVAVGQEKVIEPYVIAALGKYNPDNLITHSETRLTMTDSIRMWNGAATFGATWGWVHQESVREYATDPLIFNPILKVANPLYPDILNLKAKGIAKALNDNNVTLVTVVSNGDGIVKTATTKQFMSELSKQAAHVNLCQFQTARHVIDQERDFYRVPYMTMLLEQKDGRLQTTYGAAPQFEPLNCQVLSK